MMQRTLLRSAIRHKGWTTTSLLSSSHQQQLFRQQQQPIINNLRLLTSGFQDEKGGTAEHSAKYLQGEEKAKLDRQVQASHLDEVEKQESAGAPIPESLQAQSKSTLAKDKEVDKTYHVWGMRLGGEGKDSPQNVTEKQLEKLKDLTKAAKELLVQFRQLNDVEDELSAGQPTPELENNNESKSPAKRDQQGGKPSKRARGKKQALTEDPLSATNFQNLFRLSDSLFPAAAATGSFPLTSSFFRDSFSDFEELKRDFFRDPFHFAHHGRFRLRPTLDGSTQVFVMWSSDEDSDERDESDRVEKEKDDQQQQQQQNTVNMSGGEDDKTQEQENKKKSEE
jgi:hypothetical protein